MPNPPAAGTTPAGSKPAPGLRPKQKGSLRYKFGLSVTLLLILTVIFISAFALRGEDQALRSEMKERGITIAKNLSYASAKPLLSPQVEGLTLYSLVKDAKENKSINYAIIVDDKSVIVAHNDMSLAGQPYKRPPQVEDLGDRLKSESAIFPYGQSKNLDIGVPVRLNNQAKIGEVHVGLSQTVIDETIGGALQQIFLLAVIFIGIGILVTVVMVSLIVRPIRALEAGAQIIGQGNLDYTIKVRSADEIGNLANVFNKMTSDLKLAQVKIIEKEKMEQELETARKIQAVLLPKENPVTEGFQIVSFYRSAKEVGGDYYDFLWVNKKCLGIPVADVSGKGVPGSLGMVMTRSILRSQSQLTDAGETLTRTNALLFKDIKRGMFVTMFYAILDIARKTVNCANAGHNPLLLAHPDGKVELYNPSGIALGLDSGERFNNKMESMNIPLKTGDSFILYTDGITEAMNAANEEFTEERLVRVLGANAQLPAQELSDAIVNELMEFVAGAPQHDDITLVTVKVL